jgi:hypothetical protein
MKSYLWILSLLSSASVSAQPAPVRPEAFAYRMGIDLPGAGPFHQVALPLAVYQGVQHPNLGDLRVYNGQGEAVPHGLVRTEPAAVSQIKETAVPMFPIVASQERRGELSVEVRRSGDGTLIAVREPQAMQKGASVMRGAILDASRFEGGGVRALRLEVSASTVPFHSFTLETSDDLQQWRILKEDAQLVQLEHAGQRIDRNSVEWDTDAGKYLRILWKAPEQAPTIAAAKVSVKQVSSDRPLLLWSDPLVPTTIQGDTYEYAIPGRLPLEQLRINFAQANTLVPIELQQFSAGGSRRHRGGWEPITSTVAFRLQSPQGDFRSPDIVLNRPALDRLRLVVDSRSGGLGSAAPTLRVGFVPHVLVFLQRGEGPFSLAWGAPSIAASALPLATLVPGYHADQKLPASPARLHPLAATGLGPSPAIVASPGTRAPGTSKGVLWAVLIGGVLVLAGMVWVLVKQMKNSDVPADDAHKDQPA